MRSRNDAANYGHGRPPVVPGTENLNLGKRKHAELETDNHGNAKLQEYLEVMQPPSKSRIWANEDSKVIKATNRRAPSPPLLVVDEGENDKDYEMVPKKPTKPSILEEVGGEQPLNSKSTRTTDASTNMNSIVDEALQLPVRTPPPPSDGDWLRLRTSRLLDLVKDDDANELARDEEKKAERGVISESSMNKKFKDPSIHAGEVTNIGSSIPVAPLNFSKDTSNASGRLFVRNLPYTATEEDLKRHFESNGPASIIEVSLTEISSLVLSRDEYPDRDNLCTAYDVTRKSVLVDASLSDIEIFAAHLDLVPL